jgi:hypothetical protein
MWDAPFPLSHAAGKPIAAPRVAELWATYVRERNTAAKKRAGTPRSVTHNKNLTKSAPENARLNP